MQSKNSMISTQAIGGGRIPVSERRRCKKTSSWLQRSRSWPAKKALRLHNWHWPGCSPRDVVPIPGTKRVRYLEENISALQVNLSESDRENIAERLTQIQVVGERYAPDMMSLVQRA